MKQRPVDSIYVLAPKEIETKKPPKKGGSGWWIWGSVLASFFIILFAIFLFIGISFWHGFLGEKIALARIFLGLNGKYLILFQNNTELRPSGGFIGSFAEVDFKNGIPKSWNFETNIYKRDKSFEEKTCVPLPEPAQKVWPFGCLAMKDSNWALDFKQASDDVAWFYQKEDGNPVEGVIALDASFFEDLLKVIGPISLPKYNMVLSSKNFVKETQYYVEKEYFKSDENKNINEPKTILKDMLPIVLSRAKTAKNIFLIADTLNQNLAKKHALFSFKDPALSKIARRYDWSGEIKQTTGDYLYINSANLGGQKSSLNVKQEINLITEVQNDNTLIDTLSIVRSHTGTGEWPDGINQNYARVLVPEGAVLKDSQGIDKIDVSKESRKTVFGFWTTVSPNESKDYKISYILPFKKSAQYTLLIQKQPGVLADTINHQLKDAYLWKYQGLLDTDKYIKVDFTNNSGSGSMVSENGI